MLNVQNRQIHQHGNSLVVARRLDKGSIGWYMISFWSDRNVLESDHGNGCITP